MSSVDDLVVLNDLYRSNGRNAGLMDEEYARELQLQEVIIMSSRSAAASMARSLALESSAGPSSIPGPAATFVSCKICLDAVPPSDAHCASRGCGHAFCATCLAGYIRVKIQDSLAHVKCPEDGCGSVLDPKLCRGLLPGEVFEAWCSVMCESMLLGANKVYCPFKDCSAMMVDDDSGGVQATKCPSCRRLFCVRCGVPWHAGVGCAEYGQLAAGDRGKEDLVVMEMAKGENWKRCPNCRRIIQKSGGCRHITCRCGFEFCYGCGKQWGGVSFLVQRRVRSMSIGGSSTYIHIYTIRYSGAPYLSF